MSLRPTALALTGQGDGMYVVIDDGPEYSGPLLIPCSWAHRRIDVTREQLAADFELHLAQPSSNEEKLREALAWAIGWIEYCSENPLEDDEPEDYEARLAALALLRGKRSPFETHAGRCISCGKETAVGEVECERCAAAPEETP